VTTDRVTTDRVTTDRVTTDRVTTGRGTAGRVAWVAAERLPGVALALAPARSDPELPPLPFEPDLPEPDSQLARIVAAHLELRGPRTAAALADELGLAPAATAAALGACEAEGAVLRGQFTAGAQQSGQEEFCDRRMLARIQRLTIGRLRREIEPVSQAVLMRFLLRWQRVQPGHQLLGSDGLRELIAQLQGFESAAGAWEREILPARLHQYDSAWLDSLCLSGEVLWSRLSPRRCAPRQRQGGGTSPPTRAAPLSLMQRCDVRWLRAPGQSAAGAGDPASDETLSEQARAVYGHLRARGASFLADLAPALGCHPGQIEDALWELVGAGLATADGFASLRVLIERQRGTSRSHFDRAAADRAPRSRRWRDTLNRVRERDRARPESAMRALPTAAGRWSLLGPPDPDGIDAEASARQLLARYGVVFRDLLVRESTLPPWRDLACALRRLEARGEIRGGRFVAGFIGEQFALPEALELLRSLRQPAHGSEIVRVAATDPLNLVGITCPGPRVPAVIGNAVLYQDGVPLASLEAGELHLRRPLAEGERVTRDLRYTPPAEQDRTAERPQMRLPLGAA
jgi:ATP-dependent Lhr-like helicase